MIKMKNESFDANMLLINKAKTKQEQIHGRKKKRERKEERTIQ